MGTRIRKEKIVIKRYYRDDLDNSLTDEIIGIFDTYEEAEKVFKEEGYSEEEREADDFGFAYTLESIETISLITG